MTRQEPCTLAHIRAILPRLREDDRAELEAAGKPRHVLIHLWRESSVRRSYFVDDEIAAVWGCSGALAGETGELWLFTTPAVERVPITFIKEARRSIHEMLHTHTTLVSGVLAGYAKAEKFLEGMGFVMGDAQPYGDKMFRQVTLSR